VCLAIAGCLDGAAPSAKPVAKANVWTAAADRLDAGQWKDSTHRLVKDVTHVAKITKTPLPADYDAFWAPHIAKNVPIDDTRRAAIAKKLREWGAAK
jgi:hypothetical protein